MKIATLKAQAANLRAALEKTGVVLTHGQALEAIAGQYGFGTWDALAGTLKQTEDAKKRPAPAPRFADLPGQPTQIRVERGAWSDLYNVVRFDMDALALLHDDERLMEHLEKDPNTYDNGLDSVLIEVEGEGKDWQFSVRQLLTAKYKELGGVGYWEVEDIDGPELYLYLAFVYEEPWTASKVQAHFELDVPQMVKSAKGCQVLVVPSLDGDGGPPRYVVVPPHLNAKDIADKVIAEVKRLKAEDALLTDEEYAEREFTEDDVKAFVRTLGCTWADWVIIAPNAW